jgi:glutaconate CoA-transferase subunit A
VFYRKWDAISRDRATFLAWIQHHILETANFEEFEQRLARSAAEKTAAEKVTA